MPAQIVTLNLFQVLYLKMLKRAEHDVQKAIKLKRYTNKLF